VAFNHLDGAVMKALHFVYAAAGVLAASLSAAPTHAQTFAEWPWDWSDEPNPAPTQAIDAPKVEHLFGDWDNLQTTLLAHGVNLQVNAVSELAGNVAGGTRQDSTFANQVGIDLDINWERMAGLTGFSTRGIVVNRSGSNGSTLFGDHLLRTA